MSLMPAFTPGWCNAWVGIIPLVSTAAFPGLKVEGYILSLSKG